MTQQQSKPNYILRANINGIKGIPRASGPGDQGDCTTKYHGSPTIEVLTTETGVKTSIKEAEETRRVLPKMGRQRNNPQSKGKAESSERVLN